MILGLKKIFNKACRKAFKNDAVRALFATNTQLSRIGYEQATKRDLPNGIRLDYKTAPDNNTIKATLTLNIGSRLDPPGKEGLAHMVEHMLFMNHKANTQSLLDDITKRGGKDFATVSHKETRYEIELPRTPAHEELIYKTLAQAVFSPHFDPEDLEFEKEVLLNELYDSMDSKNDLAYDFVEQSYGRGRTRTAGTEEGIRNLTVADLEEFHAQYYTGCNTRLNVKGIPMLSMTEERLRKFFGTIPRGESAPAQPENTIYTPSCVHQRADTRQTEMRVFLPMAYRGNDFEDKKAFLLADYIHDQLQAKLRGGRNRITYSPSAAVDETEGDYYIDIDVKSRPGQMPEIAHTITTIINDIAEGKIDEESWDYVLSRRKNSLQDYIKGNDADIKAPYDRLQDKAYQYKSQTIMNKITPQHIIGCLHASLELGASLMSRGQAEIPGAYEALRQLSAPRKFDELIAHPAHSSL